MNSVWQGEEIHAMSNVDISVAVATKSGLITPIVKNTPYLSVDEISDTVKVHVLPTYCYYQVSFILQLVIL